jgi:outer membrane protein TolC
MKFRLFFLVLFLFHAKAQAAVSGSESIGLNQVFKLTQEKHKISDFTKAKQDTYRLQGISQSKLENPVISYGLGRLRYNGGAGTADYDELSISQTIPINGSKTSLRKQGRILSEIAGIEGAQTELSFSNSALLAAIRLYISQEKFEHIEERKKFFTLVSRYLRSRNFRSPQKQLEVQLIESKLEEVTLETNAVRSSLDLAKKQLRLYIGDFSDNLIKINLLEKSKVDLLSNKFSKKELAAEAIFSKKDKYFETAVSSAKRQWIPDLQVYYSQTNERFSGGNKNQVVGLGIEVPIFNRGGNKKQALMAQKTAAAAEYDLEKNKSLQLKENLLKNIRVGLEYVTIYDSKKINRKEKSLRKFERDFKKGLISAANFLEFEDSVHMIHNRGLESHYEIYSSLLSLIELSGDKSSVKEIF